MLDSVFYIAIYVVFAIQFCFTFLPIGNENSTVRRLPWVTFSIMLVTVFVYYATLPASARQQREVIRTGTRMLEYVEENQELLGDEVVRKRLVETGIITKEKADEMQRELEADSELANEYKSWLKGPQGTRLREEFDRMMNDFRDARESSIGHRYGLAPNGNWRLHQLVTYAFLHGGAFHLFGNLIFFFALAFSLEDLWGRGLFLGFYLVAAAASCLPFVIEPASVPLVGASGAIAGIMGAFLIRLYRTKIRLVWISLSFFIPLLLVGRKPFGIISLPSYLFLPYYFMTQILFWWYVNKLGQVSMVAFSVHVVGFIFGAAFALMMKASQVEEKYIDPKIESKVSFSGSPAVTEALELLDHGDSAMAERKLRSHLFKNPSDVNTIMALIQVSQRTENYTQLNSMYGRLIHHHLTNSDKEAALYAYDGLLSSFPDNHVEPNIPIRDWMSVCEYLRELGMNRESAVEYERLTLAHPGDPLTARACVQGGESAIAANENEQALRLFTRAKELTTHPSLTNKIESGIERSKTRLENRAASFQPKTTQPLRQDR